MSARKILSALTAGALAVGALALGAASAQAVEATFGEDITVRAANKAQIEGHSFSAIKLADYSSDESGYVSVTTVASLYDKIYRIANENAGGSYDDDGTIVEDALQGVDPISYISGVGPYDAFVDDDQSLGEDNQSSAEPWTGQVRQFVDDLTADGTVEQAATALTGDKVSEITGDGANGYQLTLTTGTGLWLLFDTTTPTNNNAIPMLVGTTVHGASNQFKDENGDYTTTWPDAYMGVVTMKNSGEEPEPTLYDFRFAKVNTDGAGLNGVEFSVYEGSNADVSAEGVSALTFKRDDTGRYTRAEGDDTTVTLVTGSSRGSRNGALFVSGMQSGAYTVVETKTIAGYSDKLLAKFTVTISEDGAVSFEDNRGWGSLGEVTTNNKLDYQNVVNYRSVAELPLTGGAGMTAIYTVVAALMLVGMGIAWHMRKRSVRDALSR